MSFKINPLLNFDAYKAHHINMYPEGITEVYSNFTPRSVKHLNVPERYKTNEIVWFGGQAVIQDMVDTWNENFFALENQTRLSNDGIPNGYHTELDDFIAEFSRVIAPFAGANYKVEHLYELHALGYLPLEIKTLDEGSRVPVGVPVVTVRNTQPKFFWLTNFIESYVSAELWKMSTTATTADYYRKIGNYWYEKTGASKPFLDFAFHDFSYRGMSGSMDAVKSGSAHLTAFKGSDTVPAIPYLEYHYSGKDTFIAASVPATEHSIQCAYEQDDYEYILSMIMKYPTGIVSVVADGYDYWSVLTNVLPQLKDLIMARQPDAMGFNKVVIRPDSGDPVDIICGTDSNVEYIGNADDLNDFLVDGKSNEDKIFCWQGKYYELNDVSDFIRDYTYDTYSQLNKKDLYKDFIPNGLVKEVEYATGPETKGSIQVLWELFGGTVNEKGYKVLDPHIGLIYGDSITLTRADEIFRKLEAKGFSADNVVFGIGSYSYSHVTRDTLGFAMKATNITRNGVDVPLFKNPKTDDGTKKSAKGLLMVKKITESKGTNFDYPLYQLVNDVFREDEASSALTTLFKDGSFKKHEKLEQIRNRLLGK